MHSHGSRGVSAATRTGSATGAAYLRCAARLSWAQVGNSLPAWGNFPGIQRPFGSLVARERFLGWCEIELLTFLSFRLELRRCYHQSARAPIVNPCTFGRLCAAQYGGLAWDCPEGRHGPAAGRKRRQQKKATDDNGRLQHPYSPVSHLNGSSYSQLAGQSQRSPPVPQPVCACAETLRMLAELACSASAAQCLHAFV